MLTADLSRGREKTPVQVYNEFDTDKVPEFVYCTKTHFGQDAQVDTSVENMQTCSCGDVCNSEKCECVALSEKVYYNSDGLLAVSVALGTEKCQVPGDCYFGIEFEKLNSKLFTNVPIYAAVIRENAAIERQQKAFHT